MLDDQIVEALGIFAFIGLIFHIVKLLATRRHDPLGEAFERHARRNFY